MQKSPAPQPLPAPEFSRTVVVATLPAAGQTLTVEASEAERLALARRFQLAELRALAATVRVKPVRGGRVVRVDGHFVAEVVQTCVVTLEPIASRIGEDFVAYFAEPDLIAAPAREIDLDPEQEEEPEPIEGGKIDIGEVASQHLALALDPYPRKPGASLAEVEAGAGDEPTGQPFGVLSHLARRH